MTDILLEETNPHGTIHAIVEVDDRTCYFYLHATEDGEFGMRSVWVRNLAPAPDELDASPMAEGEAPLNPKQHCRNPGGSDAPPASDLRVVWLPEGNAAALYERDKILAIIPSWSNMIGFHGYSRDSVGEGPFAWELSADNELRERFAAAERFWAAWDGDPWSAMQDSLIGQLEEALGKHAKYYAIDGGKWPPKALLRIPRYAGTALATIGVSTLPQPSFEMDTSRMEKIKRIELGAILPGNWPDEAVKGFAGFISGVAGIPWSQNTWLGPGHTIPCKRWKSPQFTFALLVDSHPSVSPFELSHQFGEHIPTLWFLPITEAEREIAVSQGSAVLLAKLPETRWMDG